ncbi:SMP-30/gluconolactonase/LRE family protein [Sphingobium ummariense]|uniref:SMP-30/Gluconolactonase/LRE-like region domain-containing protein n=1 Tax=Sphingobium ummariense RL-3 TaxID=1346791 RepID=T0IZX4_9SPHN|nr:SMP-30/gluconolactonase/LRE family protein [Sphingobium ummariense]EQB31286.1 hypothetical protein M529_15320 [Sphingobium ummariense RL-3]
MSGAHAARREVLIGVGAMALAGSRAFAQPVAIPAGVTRIDPALDRILDPAAQVEVLSRGYGWAEGPVWVPQEGGYLLFSDPRANIVHRWDEKGGARPFLQPSGLQGPVPEGVREAGANGMRLDSSGRLVIADSGTRAIVQIDLRTKKRTILADRFEGKRFNSPNDLVLAADGAIYFTDPPYGLTAGDTSPLRELDFNGVFRLAPDSTVSVIDRSHSRPNGIALSPDGRTLYLALSDLKQPHVLAYALGAKGMPTDMRVFRDMAAQRDQHLPGQPDGIKTDAMGHVFAAGPGGIHVCSPEGTLLGIVATGKPIANCCIGNGGKTLFLTSSDMLCRVALRGG